MFKNAVSLIVLVDVLAVVVYNIICTMELGLYVCLTVVQMHLHVHGVGEFNKTDLGEYRQFECSDCTGYDWCPRLWTRVCHFCGSYNIYKVRNVQTNKHEKDTVCTVCGGEKGKKKCIDCQGTGYRKCEKCGGDGEVSIPTQCKHNRGPGLEHYVCSVHGNLVLEYH